MAQDVQNAVQDILGGLLSVRKAARKWSVSRSTLHARVQGKRQQEKAGRRTILKKK